jgi:hypothetical protein
LCQRFPHSYRHWFPLTIQQEDNEASLTSLNTESLFPHTSTRKASPVFHLHEYYAGNYIPSGLFFINYYCHKSRIIGLQCLFPLWLYSPILGLGRLHETFRFISVTRSRTVGRTPWTGDQLVARPLLTAPGDFDDDHEVGGRNGFCRGSRSTRRKPAPAPLCPPQIPLDQTRARTRAASD